MIGFAAPPEGSFAAYAMELLAPLGSVKARRMFSGHGFYVDGLMFAFTSRDVLYLKSDAETQPKLIGAGSQPFVYEAKNRKQVSLNYYSMPDEAMGSPALALPWARMALEAALRKANAPKSKKKVGEAKPKKKAVKPNPNKNAATPKSRKKIVKRKTPGANTERKIAAKRARKSVGQVRRKGKK